LRLAKQVNDFQARIKDTTRKMMATVSELSMYQATAMRLQQEKQDREMGLEDARWRVQNEQPPTDESERQWYRMQRSRIEREERSMQRVVTGGGGGGMGGMGDDGGKPQASQLTRTTAEPRPNAYIPDDIGTSIASRDRLIHHCFGVSIAHPTCARLVHSLTHSHLLLTRLYSVQVSRSRMVRWRPSNRPWVERRCGTFDLRNNAQSKFNANVIHNSLLPRSLGM